MWRIVVYYRAMYCSLLYRTVSYCIVHLISQKQLLSVEIPVVPLPVYALTSNILWSQRQYVHTRNVSHIDTISKCIYKMCTSKTLTDNITLSLTLTLKLTLLLCTYKTRTHRFARYEAFTATVGGERSTGERSEESTKTDNWHLYKERESQKGTENMKV